MPYSRSENELVSAVMTGRLLTAHASDQLAEAARRMADRRVGAILVAEGDRLTGILTERDILRAAGRGTVEGTVAEWMTPDPDTVGPSATIGEAAAMMVHGGYRHVPIVDGGKLVGIVSIRDLLRLPSETPAGV
ncbi:MAG TPA: CBS domain-containing protein [Gaiellales bacterium]|jgi:CBS domain-containing protein|nr:CBS domain-containing protein [Gaiellales bacterium]